VDGTRRGIVVECKHTDAVGRPVVQKLHSAVATFEFDGHKRGMVATTGRFTGPAEEYAERFALKTKYFYDEGNLETFRQEYERMPRHERAMENKPLVAAGLVTTVIVVLGLFASPGIV
jgi:restriction endonuclease Mrr